MGAGKPQIRKAPPPQPQTPFPLLLVAAAVLIAFLVSIPQEGAKKGIVAPILSPREEEKLQKRLREIDDSEQYALFAEVNGWYPCLHSGQTTYYLLAGEVWKYGVTSKGRVGRYSAKFLIMNRVSYFVQFRGNYGECLKQEQIRLFSYPYLPENLARPSEKRLPRPPYNPVMR